MLLAVATRWLPTLEQPEQRGKSSRPRTDHVEEMQRNLGHVALLAVRTARVSRGLREGLLCVCAVSHSQTPGVRNDQCPRAVPLTGVFQRLGQCLAHSRLSTVFVE